MRRAFPLLYWFGLLMALAGIGLRFWFGRLRPGLLLAVTGLILILVARLVRWVWPRSSAAPDSRRS